MLGGEGRKEILGKAEERYAISKRACKVASPRKKEEKKGAEEIWVKAKRLENHESKSWRRELKGRRPEKVQTGEEGRKNDRNNGFTKYPYS